MSSRADDCIPAAEEIARASTSGAPEETEEIRATASVVPEENQPNSSAPPAPTPTPILPSASDVKKTKAAERAIVKKRKASASSAPKKMKPMTSSFANPIDAIPISTMPSKDLVPFGEDYEIPSGSDEENHSAASSEQIDEEIEVDMIPSTHVISSPMPQFTAEEAGVEEMEDEDVDIGCTTPVLNDDFWESQHPNSPLFTPLHQIPQSPATTVQMGSDEPHATPSVHEEIPATSAEDHADEELKSQAATETVPEIPQPVEPEIEIPEVVIQLTDTPHPKPKDPFSKKQKFKADDFFGEHVFFTNYNPCDSARIRRKRF